MIENFRRYLLKFMKPISKFLGHLYLAPKARKINTKHVLKLEELLQPGDVLLTYSEGELTNYFIEGEYKHCAMYIGQGQIVEAIGRGVSIADLEDFCASKDKIGVFRASFCTGLEAFNAVKIALKQQGKAYDYGFEPNEAAFYCAELVAYSFQVATNYTSPFVRREVMGVTTILPTDFKQASKKFSCVVEMP